MIQLNALKSYWLCCLLPFDHERLDVYQAAIAFVILSDEILEELPRGRAYLVDQLQRAASSIVLNIAEGAGEYARHVSPAH